MTTLDDVLKELYQNIKNFVKAKNIESEREYFSNPSNNIPLQEVLQGRSYEESFEYFKSCVKRENEYSISLIFTILQEIFLFSAGHDMMFQTKLKADIFVSEPIDTLIYPLLESKVKSRYNDFSVIEENPNREKNIEGIKRIVHTFIETQSLLYLLYCDDFQFSSGWEELYPGMHEEMITILKESDMTIGEFLNALIGYKCNKMKEILSCIPDPKLQSQFLQRVESLRKQKLEEASTFSHVNFPVTYFLEHTILDFLNESEKSSAILGETKVGKPPKIILPNSVLK